ncbi:hypothetical protein BC332_00387 [Capsicum chinense]|nr:hypothetical protein BC332_00387 [Capsicum chinense]
MALEKVTMNDLMVAIMEHPSLPNKVPVSGHASHELQGNQTNSCTLVNEASSQLSVNDSLSLGEPNVPSFGDDNVQLEIVDTLVDPSSIEAIVANDNTLSYESREDQLVCENGDVEHGGRLAMDDPLVIFVVEHARYSSKRDVWVYVKFESPWQDAMIDYTNPNPHTLRNLCLLVLHIVLQGDRELQVIPYSAVQLLTYETSKKLLQGKDGELSVIGRLAAVSFSSVTKRVNLLICCHVTCPLDVLRLRLAVNPGSKTMSEVAFKHAERGSPASFYNGLGASLIGISIYRVKEALPEKYQKRTEASLATGLIAATIATVMCYSLDTVRRQMQMKGTPCMTIFDAIPVVKVLNDLGSWTLFHLNSLLDHITVQLASHAAGELWYGEHQDIDFEALRILHICYDRANEVSVKLISPLFPLNEDKSFIKIETLWMQSLIYLLRKKDMLTTGRKLFLKNSFEQGIEDCDMISVLLNLEVKGLSFHVLTHRKKCHPCAFRGVSKRRFPGYLYELTKSICPLPASSNAFGYLATGARVCLAGYDFLWSNFVVKILSKCFYLRSTLGEQKKLQTYIIRVSLPTSEVNLESYYRSFLPVEEDQTSSSRLVHSYHHVISGFAAKLTHGELKEMEKKDGFITAKPQKMLALQTTHTLNFLGLQQNSGVWQESNYGRGVIIGLLDSGITPDHPSFHDNNMPPPPEKWKGKCEFTDNVTCNNKLIGARNLLGGGSSDPPFDDSGHGTHTSSTAAGNFVDHANIFGNANGTSAGMAPLAHIAMYKVCSGPGITCAEVDMLAAIEASIHDGVDVLSISIGGLYKNFYDDYLAVGAFAAMRNGILVVASAGNKGPGSGTLSNEAPWILTVGASSHDRKIVATAVLGNGESYHGQTLFQGKDFPPTLFPLAYSREIAKCEPILLKNADVRGKIVVCDYAILSFADGEKIKAYITSSSTARAGIIFEGTMMGFKDAPSVAYFWSRGPNNASPGILKPDIIGPELNILAAWPSSLRNINSTFNIISGTSMSCPHLSGTAALLKIAHSDWSPAAIKSVVMTTADQFNREGQPILDEREFRADVFAIGAGHVNPTKAITPGLIYDIHPMNYSRYLCGLGYTNIQIGLLVSQKMNCSLISSISEAELNYPSFSILLGEETQKYSRIVTNVGDGNSTYVTSIAQIPGVHTVVEPMELVFTKVMTSYPDLLILSTNRDAMDWFMRYDLFKDGI